MPKIEEKEYEEKGAQRNIERMKTQFQKKSKIEKIDLDFRTLNSGVSHKSFEAFEG